VSRLVRCIALVASLAPAAVPAPAPGDDGCAARLERARAQTSLIEKRKLLEEAVGSCPRNDAIAYEYAFALERLRRYPEALRYYRVASGLGPRNGKAFIGAGDTLMVLGDPTGAAAAYARGLALSPGDARARKALELARIKSRAQRGEDISSEEFVRVMTEAESKGEGPAESAEGPMVRMQILFRVASAKLDRAAFRKLEVVGKALRSKALGQARVQIAGHTDDSGSPATNLELSRLRAEAVQAHLVARYGIARERLPVAFFGQGLPIVPNTSEGNKKLNRRVQFRLLK